MKLQRLLVVIPVVAMAMAGGPLESAAGLSDAALAKALADENGRAYAVNLVATSDGRQLPLLLSWTKSPPPGVDAYDLDAGLADVFGRLRTKAAIPFLISHITLFRSRFTTTIKERTISLDRLDQVESNMPAVAALVHIGRAALPLLEQAYYGPTTSDERCALLSVIYRINDPESVDFFERVRLMLEQERSFASEAIRTAGAQK
jgi:hypothetical protein